MSGYGMLDLLLFRLVWGPVGMRYARRELGIIAGLDDDTADRALRFLVE